MHKSDCIDFCKGGIAGEGVFSIIIGVIVSTKNTFCTASVPSGDNYLGPKKVNHLF